MGRIPIRRKFRATFAGKPWPACMDKAIFLPSHPNGKPKKKSKKTNQRQDESFRPRCWTFCDTNSRRGAGQNGCGWQKPVEYELSLGTGRELSFGVGHKAGQRSVLALCSRTAQ
jgi:hypothetical protein